MFNYEKRLQYPVNIKRTDAQMAKAIMSQFGGPDGETGASMRYLSQRFAMPYREVMGILTDVGTSVSLRRATRYHVTALLPGRPVPYCCPGITHPPKSSLAFFFSGVIINVSPVPGGVWLTPYRRCLGSRIRFSRRNTLRLVCADMVHR